MGDSYIKGNRRRVVLIKRTGKNSHQAMRNGNHSLADKGSCPLSPSPVPGIVRRFFALGRQAHPEFQRKRVGFVGGNEHEPAAMPVHRGAFQPILAIQLVHICVFPADPPVVIGAHVTLSDHDTLARGGTAVVPSHFQVPINGEIQFLGKADPPGVPGMLI